MMAVVIMAIAMAEILIVIAMAVIVIVRVLDRRGRRGVVGTVLAVGVTSMWKVAGHCREWQPG